MKHAVFIGGAHYPEFSAVGYCSVQVQKSLVGALNVSMIAYRTQSHQPQQTSFCGIGIHRIETPQMRWRNILAAKRAMIWKLPLTAVRIAGAIKRLLSPETIDRKLVAAYLRQLEELPTKPDAVIPLVFPFESVVAALEYKDRHPEVMLIPYLFDDFVDSGSLHVLRLARRLKRKRHLQLEKEMLERASAVLSMHPLEAHFHRNFEKRLTQKLIFLEHPLLVRPQQIMSERTKHSLKLCYTGSLIRNVREPDGLVALLREIRPKERIEANFFVMGNASTRVPTSKFANGVQVNNHGRVEKAVAEAAVNEADILLNLGEAQGGQISSKVFEYMSTGKPIIHLAYKRDDAVTKVLDKYPLALCLEMTPGNQMQNAELIDEFVDSHGRSRMSFDAVRDIYPKAAPEATAKVIRHLLLHGS